jgi:PPM family protein phosphatase
MGAAAVSALWAWLGGQALAPYWILGAWVVCVWLLLLLRNRGRLAHPDRSAPAVEIGNGQTIGARSEQDDYFASILMPYGTLAVLADGISGLSGGKVASTTAVNAFLREFGEQQHFPDPQQFLADASRLANQEILHQLRGVQGGTTMVAAIVREGLLYWGAVGDSMLMVFRGGELIAINQKHTLQQELEERYLSGEITRDEALDNPQRNRLINYLGYEHFSSMEIAEEPFALQAGDKVLLCSDGVYNTLSEIEMENILSLPLSPFDAAQAMIERIEEKRLAGQDNATVMIVQGW